MKTDLRIERVGGCIRHPRRLWLTDESRLCAWPCHLTEQQAIESGDLVDGSRTPEEACDAYDDEQFQVYNALLRGDPLEPWPVEVVTLREATPEELEDAERRAILPADLTL